MLVVVKKKEIERFREVYPTCLIAFNEQDFDNWQKRTLANVQHQNQNIEDEAQREEIVSAEYNQLKHKFESQMKLPCAIPGSEKFLGLEDPDGNQIFRLTCMKD